MFLQTAESVAESVLSLASAEACVMVTVDPASDDVACSPPPSAPVVVHSSQLFPTVPEMSAVTSSSSSIQPLEVGAVGYGKDPRKAAAVAAAAAAAAAVAPPPSTDNKEAGQQDRSVNPMSVSVPNLTSSVEHMEQTVSLLESFAAVARRNLGNSTNNMSRSNNANSLVRLAMQPNSPGKL